MPRCAVNVCAISAEQAKNREVYISFHTFPKDPQRRAKWVKLCGLVRDPGTVLYVCSQHFAPDAFVTNATVKKTLMSTGRNILTKDAVPTIRSPEPSDDEVSTRSRRYQAKERKEIVANLLTSYQGNEGEKSKQAGIEERSDQEPWYIGSNMDLFLQTVELAKPIPLPLPQRRSEDDLLEDSGCYEFDEHNVVNSTIIKPIEIDLTPREKSRAKLDHLERLARKRKAIINQLRRQVMTNCCID